jgi:hypothetical protein
MNRITKRVADSPQEDAIVALPLLLLASEYLLHSLSGFGAKLGPTEASGQMGCAVHRGSGMIMH